jgi:hypothetical protein
VPFANFKAKFSACLSGRDLCFLIAASAASRIRSSLRRENLSLACQCFLCRAGCWALSYVITQFSNRNASPSSSQRGWKRERGIGTSSATAG